ncbi:hypothetical protein RFI_33867 [Reticulomyxa filosa]|uniref:Uncharacterized protein n=1 Tax=Reticulomyxa filosa TaxID=46433 RepID=X6LS04_RETFI|nr:hypothetical protein RFI_33867 [Reticulomyxa filosa]|eukprot:ETO03535.1 hypothetical protein RFI_33867 [Reticulomyxa filosa]
MPPQKKNYAPSPLVTRNKKIDILELELQAPRSKYVFVLFFKNEKFILICVWENLWEEKWGEKSGGGKKREGKIEEKKRYWKNLKKKKDIGKKWKKKRKKFYLRIEKKKELELKKKKKRLENEK